MTGHTRCPRGPLRQQPEPRGAILSGAMQNQLTELQSMVEELCRRSDAPRHDLPEELFQFFTDLLGLGIERRTCQGTRGTGADRDQRLSY